MGRQGGGGDVVARCGEVGREGGQQGGEGGKGSLTSIEDKKSDLVLFICKKKLICFEKKNNFLITPLVSRTVSAL